MSFEGTHIRKRLVYSLNANGLCQSDSPVILASKLHLIIRFSVVSCLVFASVLGFQISTVDKVLWLVSPARAYGLVAFSGVSLTLAVLLLIAGQRILAASLTVASLQVSAMLGDVLSASSVGVTIPEFATYLFGNVLFVALLVVQLSIAALSWTGLSNLPGKVHIHTRMQKVFTVERIGFSRATSI